MVPPGIPGRSDADLPPDVRPGRRPPAAGRRGLPGRRRVPGDDPARPVARGSTRRSSAELKRELGITVDVETMGFDGYFDRLADRSAADLGARLGRRLPGRERLPGRPPRAPASRTTTATGARPTFDAAIAEAVRRPIRPPRPPAYDAAEAIVRDEVPVVPVAYGTGLGAVADRAARRAAERPRDHPDGGPGVGAMIGRGGRPGALVALAAARARCWPVCAGRAAADARRPSARRPPHRRSGRAISSSQPVTVTARDRPGRAAADRSRAPSARTSPRSRTHPASGRRRSPTRSTSPARPRLIPNTPFERALAADPDRRRRQWRSGPSCTPDLRRRPVRLEDARSGRSSASTGTRATTRSAPGR